jgi:predicted RecB family nuclease
MKKITPTALAKASRCMHSWYLECYGDKCQKKPFDAGLEMLIAQGVKYEQKVVSKISSVVEPKWDGKDFEQGLQATTELMKKGVAWIYQAVLLTKDIYGFPDLLKKVDERSNFGDYSYMPVDIKSHKAVLKKDRFQLFAYSLLLKPLLGYQTSRAAIWLNTGIIEEVDLDKRLNEYEDVLSEMKEVQLNPKESIGFRCGECGMCAWADFCSKEWKETARNCLVYGVTGETARKLWRANFKTYHDIANSTPENLIDKAGMSEKTVAKIYKLAKAWKENQALLIVPVEFPKGIPIHYWDIETFGGVTYLHGNIRIYESEREEKLFFADDPSGEKEVWHQYLDYLAKDDEAIVYNWADYERGFAYSLWEKYGGNQKGFKHLDESMIDQCAFVRKHFALPVSSYSIKKVAPFFGFNWTADDAGGLNSESWYSDWLETKDQTVKEKILQYNLDDVIAMEVIDKELRRLYGK